MRVVLQAAVVWLVVSLVVMAGLSAFVYLSGSRRRGSNQPTQLTFDDAQVYEFAGDRRPEQTAPPTNAPRPEPAITHPVSSDSGALDRLLAGVKLPCGLERLRPEGEDETISMAFVTSGYEPRMVAVSVVDELERLGLDVEPLSYTEARVWRDGLELAVTIFLEPRQVIRNRRAAFATAPPDSVVIEFSVV